MMTDKHIDQWAGYLLDEYPNGWEIQKSLPECIWKVMIKMYKKGYEDCLEENK